MVVNPAHAAHINPTISFKMNGQKYKVLMVILDKHQLFYSMQSQVLTSMQELQQGKMHDAMHVLREERENGQQH